MKKLLSAIAAVLFAGVMALSVTGCSSAFAGPTDQWCKTTINYGSADVKVPVYFYYATKETTLSGSNYTKTLPVGLTVFADVHELEISDAKIAEDKYLVKSFAENTNINDNLEETESDDDADATNIFSKLSFSMTTTKWTIACLANASLYTNTTTTLPGFLSDDYDYESLEDISQISWKKLLVTALLSKLISD